MLFIGNTFWFIDSLQLPKFISIIILPNLKRLTCIAVKLYDKTKYFSAQSATQNAEKTGRKLGNQVNKLFLHNSGSKFMKNFIIIFRSLEKDTWPSTTWVL